jgi:hypothetical protein
MVTHIVIFTWIAGTTETQIADLGDALDQMAADLSHLGKICHGPDLRLRDGNGDYALVASFRDRARWDAYQADPRHKAFVHDFVAPIQASRLTAQI